MSEGCGANIAVRRGEPAVTRRLGHQPLGCEGLPGSDQRWPDGIVGIRRDCPELVKALAEVADKAMGWAEALRSPRGLAPTKHPQSSFEMLMITPDSLLHGLSGDGLGFRSYGGQRGRVRAAALSVVSVCGVTPVFSRAERKKAVAASVSRCSRNSTSMTCPYSSIAR
jgi:hypothetical protein